MASPFPIREAKPRSLLVLAVLALVPALSACPGHLEESWFLLDGGSPPGEGPTTSTVATSGNGGGLGEGASSGGAPGSGPTGGPGGASTGGGGSGGTGGEVGRDAGPGGAAGGGGAPDGGPGVQYDPLPCYLASEVSSKIFGPLCTACHNNGPMAAGGLDLQSPMAKARLLNVKSKKATCQSSALIVDAPAVGGVLFDKLAGTQAMGCGAPMPLAKPMLSAEQIQCLKDWIKPPDCTTADWIQKNIFDVKCVKCHSGSTPAGPGLDLQLPGAKARLINQMSKKATCQATPLATANPAGGVFFDKLGGMPAVGCGAPMPLNGVRLNDYEMQCLKDWVSATPPPPPPPPDAGPPDAGPPKCSPDPASVPTFLLMRCGVGGACHGDGKDAPPAANLDLSSPNVKARLLNVRAKGVQCGTPILINADATGLFFDKIGPTPPCGERMPFGMITPYVTPEELKCLKDWIKPTP